MRTKILIAVLAILCSITASAYNIPEDGFEKDGFIYEPVYLVDEAVYLIGHTLSTKTWNEKIELPGHVTDESGNEYDVIGIGSQALKDLYIQLLIVPPTIQTINGWAFSGSRIIRMNIKPGNLGVIEPFAFSNVSSADEMIVFEVPEGVSAICRDGLYNSSVFGTLVLPSTLKSVGPLALSGNFGVRRVVIKAVEPPVMTDAAFGLKGRWSTAMQELPIPVSGAVLAVPKGCVEKYRQASGWSRFANIEEMTPEEAAGIVGIPTDYPSPIIEATGSRGAINVKANSATAVRITDVQGRTVASATISGSHTFSLPQGIYIVSAQRHSIKVKVD